jgi:hypothetical protein
MSNIDQQAGNALGHIDLITVHPWLLPGDRECCAPAHAGKHRVLDPTIIDRY